MEIKKDDKKNIPEADDIVKINLELQVMLRQLILLNVVYGTVYCIADTYKRTKIYQMTFKNGCLYISYVTETLYLPRNAKDICLRSSCGYIIRKTNKPCIIFCFFLKGYD